MKLKERIPEMRFTDPINIVFWVVAIVIMTLVALLVGFGGTWGLVKFIEYLGKLGG